MTHGKEHVGRQNIHVVNGEEPVQRWGEKEASDREKGLAMERRKRTLKQQASKIGSFKDTAPGRIMKRLVDS